VLPKRKYGPPIKKGFNKLLPRDPGEIQKCKWPPKFKKGEMVRILLLGEIVSPK